MGNTLVNIPASQTQQLKSFGLTHFQYQDGDHFGELLALIGAIVLSVLVVVSRVYLGYHTLRQVLAGVGVGVVAGIAWYQFVELVRRTGILDYALRSGICHWLLIRDSRNVTDIALVEYNLSMNQKLKTL
ncbi:hypothetical protein GGH19_002054 [Coemansia sp. RSA 1807]|nr:hypothetical protein GGH19_002054 [Coemansia sp. RSA 1807]